MTGHGDRGLLLLLELPQLTVGHWVGPAGTRMVRDKPISHQKQRKELRMAQPMRTGPGGDLCHRICEGLSRQEGLYLLRRAPKAGMGAKQTSPRQPLSVPAL